MSTDPFSYEAAREALDNLNGLTEERTSYTVHSWAPAEPSCQVKLEKNSRSLNYEINVHAASVDECLAMIRDARRKLQAEYPNGEAVS